MRASLAGGLVVGALFGAYAIGHQSAGATSAATLRYQQITFRLGAISAARFAPEGKSVIYSALHDERSQVFAAVPGNAEARSVSDSGASLFAVSAKGELALSLPGRNGQPQLARAELSGGAPRAIADSIVLANWSPDGGELLVVRRVNGHNRLEYPLGHTILETDASSLEARPSPCGTSVAIVEFRVPSYAIGRIELIDREGHRRPLTKTYANISSFAWTADGKEIWYTCGDNAFSSRTLCAVGFDGKSRVLLESPVDMRLHDIAADGRILLSTETFHHRIAGRLAGQSADHEIDLSWFEGSDQPVLSPDGRRLLSTVFGDAAEATNMAYLRDVGSNAAVRLGAGNVLALSPDGGQALVGTGPRQSDLVLLPTATGSERKLTEGTFDLATNAFFLPDGKRIVFRGP